MAVLSSALTGARNRTRGSLYATRPTGGAFSGTAPRVGAPARYGGTFHGAQGQGPYTFADLVAGFSGHPPVSAGFTPTATQPPAGTYDPVLDANLGAAQRGYGDTLGDYAPVDGSLGAPGRLSQRAWDDYQLAVQQTHRQGDESLANILRQRARATQDFGTQRTEGQHKADLQNQDAAKSYMNLASRQADALNSAGASESGAALQAGEKRGANEALVHSRIGDALNTLMGHIKTNETRFGEDSARAETQLTGPGGAIDRTLAKLGLGYQRGTDDAATTLAKAQRELTFFGTDTAAQKAYQAQAGGWKSPTPPKNEFSDENGPYRIVVHGGQAVKVRPNGTVESTRPATPRATAAPKAAASRPKAPARAKPVLRSRVTSRGPYVPGRA